MYKSLFKTSIQATGEISQAVTSPALFLDNFNHSAHTSFFPNTSHFKFNIISTIESLTQGKVEYS
ncbi:MAG: hypothetical protein LBC61_01750 [Candidatus Peribacteria bacterium]|jgi:hypothetical protein|nr:hypothetical protein [Candidatus Peribacteria bacterium]